MKKSSKVLFIAIVAIFVVSIISIPLSSYFTRTSAPDQGKEALKEMGAQELEGKIVKQDDKYFLEAGGLRLLQLKDGKAKIKKFVDQEVKISGEMTTSDDTGAIEMKVDTIELNKQ